MLLDIAARENTPAMVEAARALRADRIERQAVMFRSGRPLDGTHERVTVRGGVAIIPIEGPIFRHADLFSEASGATSLDTIARNIQIALDAPEVESILLSVDSPGGDAFGISEAANTIMAARSQKPITAYIDGFGASAAYWLASAASDVVVDDLALVGSIGVVMAVPDPSKALTRDITFVSSQSPHKRPNPTTEQGKEKFQTLVDDMADVFIAAVSRQRNVSVETVLSDFGQGGLFVGQQAVTTGLADRVGSFEQVITELQEQARQRVFGGRALATQSKEPISMATMKDRVWAMFGGMDENEAAIGQAPAPAIGHPQGTQVVAGMTYAPGATALLPLAGETLSVSGADPEKAALHAALAKERAARITSEAEQFYTTQFAAHKALPAERTAMIDAYTTLASELPERGPTLLTALYTSRPAHTLADELIPVGQDATVLVNTTKTPDPNAAETEKAAADARAWAAKQNGHAPVKGA